MPHPYIVDTIVPNPGCNVDPNFDERKVVEEHARHLQAISDRNKKLIPADVYEKLKKVA